MLVDQILSRHHPLFGEVLVALGNIGYTELAEALSAQRTCNSYLGDILVERGWITAADIASVLRIQEEYERRHGRITEATRTEAIAEVIAKISAGEPIDRVLQEIIQQVRSALGFDRAGIFLINRHADRVEGTWGTDPEGNLEDISHCYFPLRSGPGFSALYASDAPYFYAEDAGALWGHDDVKHHAIVPMKQGGDVIGFIAVDNFITKRPFGPEAAAPLQVFAAGAALAVAQARLTEALRQSRQNYEPLIDTIDGIVWECDARTFQFMFVSKQAERLLGYPVEQWVGAPSFWRDHLHPDDAQWVPEFCAKATAEKRNHEFEYRMIAADGRPVWLHDLVTAVVENDQVVRLRGIMVDITERKRAELRDRALLQIGTLVVSQLGVDEVLRSIVEQVRSALEFDRAGVFLVDEEHDEVETAFGTADDGTTLDERGVSVKWSASRYRELVTSEQGLFYTSDAFADYGWASHLGNPVRHCAVVPCRARGQIVGLISADNALTQRPFGMMEINPLRVFADLAGLAIDNARLLERSHQARARAQTLARITQSLAQTLDVKHVMRTIWTEIQALLKPDSFYARLYDRDRDKHVAVLHVDQGVEYDVELDVHVADCSVAGWVHRHLQTLIVQDTDAEADRLLSVGIVRTTPIGSGQPSRSLVAVPILATNNDYLGCLAVYSYQPHAFSADDVQLLDGIAGCASAAIRNALLHQQAQRRAQQLEALNKISRAMASEVNLQRRLERLYTETVSVIPADTFVVSMARARANEFAVLLSVDEGVRYSGLTLKAEPGTPARHLLDTGESLLIADMSAEEEQARWRHTLMGSPKASRSWLVAPMIYDSAVTGFVGCYSYAPHRYTAEHLDLLVAVANRAAVALRNARLYERTQSQLNELSALYEIASSVARGTSPQALAQQVTAVLPGIIPCHSVGIILHDPDTQTWRLVSHAGSQPSGFAVGMEVALDSTVGNVIRTGEPIRIDDVTQELSYVVAVPDTRSELCVPLKVGNRVIGAINFEAPQLGRFRRHHEQLAMTAASNIAALIDNSRLIAELQQANEELTTMQDQLVQAEKLRALGEVASGVAHDFNNRLSGVLGFTELLLRSDGLDEKSRDYLEKIRLSAEDAAATVRRMQNFARQDPDHGLAPLDVNSLVHDVVGLTRHKWHDTAFASGLAIQVSNSLNATVLARGNAPELREVLTNLMYNAVDAMPNGGVITVQTSVEDDGTEAGRRIVIAVSDTGTGMTEDVKSRIFDPFFTTKGVSGTGLGLSVCYGIVQRHQGVITVDSAPGAGTTFTIRLPAATASAPSTPTRRSGNFAPWRILCVEDDHVVRTLVVDLLNAVGHRAVAAATGAEAVARFERESFDLVITDQGMPGMTGEVVARLVKERSPRTPVILLSGWAGEYTVTRPALPNIDAYVAKPVQLQELATIIQDVMIAATAPA